MQISTPLSVNLVNNPDVLFYFLYPTSMQSTQTLVSIMLSYHPFLLITNNSHPCPTGNTMSGPNLTGILSGHDNRIVSCRTPFIKTSIIHFVCRGSRIDNNGSSIDVQLKTKSIRMRMSRLHIPEHTRSLSGSL